MDIEKANQTAVERMITSRPRLVSVAPAAQVVPGMHPRLLLHAGPPIDWKLMSGPLRGAVIGALLFEGLAKNESEAREMAQSGDIEFDSCHHHQSVGPMAGVTSSSMWVYVVEDTQYGNHAFSTLNEGYGKVLRYGAYSEEVLDRLRWMNQTMAPLLAEALPLRSELTEAAEWV